MENILQPYSITNVINYIRKSRQDVQREKQTGEDTLHSQKKLMSKILDTYGIPYDQKLEIGSGDKISTRPVFKEVLEDLKIKKYDAIAVKEISRMGRGSYADMGIIYDLLKDNRIFVITPNKIYDPANSSDLRQIRFEMFMSREEFETTRERLTSARHTAALEGKWMGNIPFGYKRNPTTLKLEPVEEDAKIIKFIFDIFLHGYEGKTVRDRAIATILTRLGIKTAKHNTTWDTTTITRILRNDAYIGIAKFRTTKRNSDGKIENRPESEHIIVEDAHDPIIAPEDFFKVQEIIKTASSRPKTRLDAETFELTGLFTCKQCGKKPVINRYKRKRLSGEYYDTYIKCKNGCFNLKYGFAEKAIINLLNHFKEVDQNELATMYAECITKQDEEEKEPMKKQIQESMERKKADIEKRLKFIMEKHSKGIYTDEDFLLFKRDIDKEKQELEKMMQNNNYSESAASKETIDVDQVRNNFIKIIDAYKTEDIPAADKNDLIRSIFENVNIKVVEKGTKTQAPKIEIEATLTSNFWEGNF